MAFNFIDQALVQQREQARFRQTTCIEKVDGVKISVAGKAYINFSSNDYLGLNNNVDIQQALQQGADRFGTSASASALITGHHYAHQALTDEICDWLNKPRCLLYSSGFAANSGALQALGQKSTCMWLDKLSHASLIDGALASNAHLVKRFKHNSIGHAKQLLAKQAANQEHQLDNTNAMLDHLFVSEGVFSMDGDRAPVAQLSELARQNNGWLYCDDAHSIGVIGEHGQGSSSFAPVDIVMATFGKAIASSGAFIACEDNVAEYLTNFSRHYIYSTAISPAMAWATKRSIELIRNEHWRREKIAQLSHCLIESLDKSVDVLPTESSIHAIVIGCEAKTLKVANALRENGFWVTAIRPPTVPNNSSRLRVTITSSHNIQEIKALAKCINKVVH